LFPLFLALSLFLSLSLSLSLLLFPEYLKARSWDLPLRQRDRKKSKTMARGKAGFIKPMFERAKWKVLRGDTVAVTAGRDAGATGTVLKVIRDEKRPAVLVEGCNLVRLIGKGGSKRERERERERGTIGDG